MNRGNFKSTTSMLDLFLLMAAGFVSLFVLAFILIQPPTDPASEIEMDEELFIKLTWEHSHNNDLDLWLLTPAGEIVSFKRKEARGAVLERDDRGWNADLVVRNGKEVRIQNNTEVVRIKQLEDGDYYISVQYYSKRLCDCLVEQFQVEVYDGISHRTLAIYTGEVVVSGETPILVLHVRDGRIVAYSESDKQIALAKGGL